MMERKLYKTKLCILYRRGNCPRESCNFAHGDAELRNFTGSLEGRRDYRNGDLREKLDTRYSPRRRCSPGRDTRRHHAFHSQKPVSHDRDYSLSRSPVKRRHRKVQHLDGQSDTSGSVRISDGSEDQIKEGKIPSPEERDVLEEQLKQTQLDVEILDDHKCELENFLEKKDQEAHKLSTTIKELEMQLNKEQEDCKRITSKIKKFIKANERYLKAQEELKRSQARLQRLGDLLGSDTSKPGTNEEDSGFDMASDGEPNGDNQMSPGNEQLNHASPIKKRLRVPGTSEEAKPVNLRKKERFSGMITRAEKRIKSEGPIPQLENNTKGPEAKKSFLIRKDIHKPQAEEYKHKRARNSSPRTDSLDKVKGSEVVHLLPSTNVAAHVVDELVELEDKSEAVEATSVSENVPADNRAGLTYILPPPPTVTQNAYKQYEGDDEDVDVEDIDREMLDIDLNCEVDIEQV